MAEVFAGWTMGFALSLLIAPAAAYAMTSPGRADWAERIAPRGVNVVALTMVLQMIAALLATAAGILFGLALAGFDERRPAAGLGSPNAAYTFFVLALTAVLAIPLLLLPGRRYVVAGAIAFALLFGWATPWLAQAGQ